MRLYLLILLCLVAVILVLQPKQDRCCQGLEGFTTNPGPTTLQIPNESFLPNTLEEQTQEESSQDGFVFSLPLGQSTLKSALPDEASDSSEQTEEPTSEQTDDSPSNIIISSSEDLTILATQPQDLNLNGPDSNLSIFSKLFTRANLITALILFAASFLQGASGFAFAVLMIPLLVWSGFGLAEASMFTAVSALFITSFMVFNLKDYVKWKVLWPTMFLRIAAMAVGIFLLAIITMFDRVLIRQILGLLLLTIVGIQILSAGENETNNSSELAPHWSWLAFGSGGFLGGLVGFGGPAVALWVMAHNWSNKESRSFLTASYWSILPIQIILLLSTFGKPIAQTGIQALYFVPIVLLGVFLGIWFGNQGNKAQLRLLVQILLVVTGLVSLLAPYIGTG